METLRVQERNLDPSNRLWLFPDLNNAAFFLGTVSVCSGDLGPGMTFLGSRLRASTLATGPTKSPTRPVIDQNWIILPFLNLLSWILRVPGVLSSDRCPRQGLLVLLNDLTIVKEQIVVNAWHLVRRVGWVYLGSILQEIFLHGALALDSYLLETAFEVGDGLVFL